MSAQTRSAQKSASRTASEGGSRAAGGFTFQANCSAYVATHLLTGHRLGWLERLAEDIPTAIVAESGGPGDDLRIALRDGRAIEVQVKRGLSRGSRLWAALADLARGLHDGDADFGLLITCPQASRTVLTHLARDLERMGDGRTDQLSDIGSEWQRHLQEMELPLSLCARVRIISLAVTDVQRDAVRLAEVQLRPLLKDPDSAPSAWAALAADGLRLIEYRGRRTLESTLRVFAARGIDLSSDASPAAPAAMLAHLCDWTASTNANYSIIGHAAPIPIDTGWIPQYGRVLGDQAGAPHSFVEALRRYRTNLRDETEPNPKRAHGSTIGRFIKHCVVLAGPGMGKTTLLTKLARTYAADGQGVLKVRLRALSERMQATGCGLEEGLFALGLDTSGVAPAAARHSAIRWTILCDGLDECGTQRASVARDLAAFAAARPDLRIIVTSRSIGYEPGALAAWRHYALEPLSRDELRRSVQRILNDACDREKVDAIVAILEASPAIGTIASSPLLLGLAVALAVRQGSIGRTEADLYQRIFALIEEAASARASKAGLTDVELTRTIDIIGHILITNPAESAETSLGQAADLLSGELGCPRLDAMRRVELAIRYWCEVGLIERVYHQGRPMLAFVHKTFGEFACARYIRDSAPAEQRAMLARAVALQADPVIDFAAALGLGRHAFAVLLQDGKPWSAETIVRALALANHTPPVDMSGLLEPIVERAFDLLRESRADLAERIGESLAELHPDHRSGAYPIALNHLEADTPNLRLAAWSLILGSEFDTELRPRLLDAVAGFTVAPEAAPGKRSLLGGMIARKPASQLLQAFALSAADHLLRERDAESDNAMIALLRSPSLSNLGFLQALEPIIARHERSDINAAMREHWYGRAEDRLAGIEQVDLGGYEDAAGICEAAQLQALAGETAPDPRLTLVTTGILPNLSAFVEYADWGSESAGDIWHWQREAWRPVEFEVLRSVARLGMIDPDQLAIEAASLLANRDKVRGHMTFAWFNQTGPVDIPPLDWSAARSLPLDMWALEQALHHGSHFLMVLAANLLDAVLFEGERRKMVERLFAAGRGPALQAAASLGCELPRDIALDLAMDRLLGPCVAGLDYLFEMLSKFGPPYDDRLHSVLASTLVAPRPEVAIAAAEFVSNLGKAEARLQALLAGAIDHWTANPPARPRFGEPPDPREALVNTLAAVGELSDDALLDLLPYRLGRRSSSALTGALAGRWKSAPSFRDRVFDRAEKGEISPHDLAGLIEVPTELTTNQRATALRLVSSSNSRVRRAIVGIFAWPGFLDESTRPAFRVLLEDGEDEIRAVAQLIDSEETFLV